MFETHRGRHGGGYQIGHEKPMIIEDDDFDEDFARLLGRHTKKKVQLSSQRASHRKELLANKRGQIDLEPQNKTDYKKDGFNVQLTPIPQYWSHEDLRQLLHRVNAPCPIAWNIQPKKSIAWIDYDNPQHQREAINALNNLHMPGGHILGATPVDVEKKKRPAFYRECDDGRVLPNEIQPRRSSKLDAQGQNAMERTMEVDPTPVAAVPTTKAVKQMKGRGFAAFAGTATRMRADEGAEEVAGATEGRSRTEQTTGDGYMSDGSIFSEAKSIQSIQQSYETTNAALLAKYKLILKRLNEKKRARAKEPAINSDDEM